MAHFAQLDDKNIVTRVIVVGNDDITDINGDEVESIGIAFCQKLMGADTNWKKTSYNSNFRGNYAGLGATYMSGVRTLGVASTDIFIGQQPFPSWSIGINTARWYPPDDAGIPPERTAAQIAARKDYRWNEADYNKDPSTAWNLITP